MPRLQLSLACWDYDRTRALAEGSERPEGIDLIYHKLLVEETFFRMLRNREFDAAEMSLSSYCVSLMRDDPGHPARRVRRRTRGLRVLDRRRGRPRPRREAQARPARKIQAAAHRAEA